MPSSSTNGSRRDETGAAKPIWRRYALQFALGLPVGGLLGFLSGRFGLFDWLERWTAIDVVSLVIAALLTLLGVFTWIASSSAWLYHMLLQGRDKEAEAPDPEALTAFRRQAIVVFLAGPLLAAPPMLAALGLDESTRLAAAGAILIVLAVQSWLNWRVWREGDELVRSVTILASAVCMGVFQLLLFVWAMLVKLGFAPDIGSWTMVTVLMAGYLVVSTVIGMRRGLGVA